MALDPTLDAPDYTRSVTDSPTVEPALGAAGTLTPPPPPSSQPQAVHPNAQQLAEIDAQLAEQGQPPAPRNPIWDFTPEQLVDLQRNTDGKYNFVQQFANDKQAQQNPEIQRKVEDALALHLEKGISLSDVGHAATGIIPNVSKMLWSLAKSTVGRVATGLRGAYEGATQDPTQMTPEKQTGQQELLEQLGGTETALSGLATQASKFGRRGLLHQIGEKVGLSKPYTQLTQDEKSSLLGDALAQIQAQKTIAAAHGPIVTKLFNAMGVDTDDPRLKAVMPRPEEMATHAEGDPVTFAAMAKLFGGAGELTKAATPEMIKAAMADAGDWAAQKARTAVGKTITGVGVGAKKAADVTAAAAPLGGGVLGAAGIIGEHHGVGAYVGYRMGKELAETIEKHQGELNSLADLGRQVSGEKPLTSNVAQVIKSGAEAAPGALADLGKGVAFDAALGGTTGETPEDIQGLGFGTVLGALGAGKRMGLHVLSGQIVGPKEWGSVVTVPGSGSYPSLEKLHQQAMAAATPGVRNRINAVRGFARTATPNAEQFFVNGQDPEAIRSAISAAGGDASKWDPTNRGQSLGLSNGKSINIINDASAAPHEAIHPLEKVIGEDGMRDWDTWAQSHYAGKPWNDFARRYAELLPGNFDPSTQSVQEFLADKSGFGRNDALEKLIGEGKSPADARQYLADLEQQGKGWQDVLTPDEQKASGDRYISRELFAEHGDALFKRSGGKPGLDPAGLQKVAQGIGNVVTALGGNPIPGRLSEGLQAPLSFEGLKKAQQMIKGAQPPTVEPREAKAPAAAPAGMARTTIPTTPEQRQQAVEEAKAAANSQQTEEKRDALSSAADAIAKGQGIIADTQTETGKKFFPYRVVPTKEGGHTILGWDPDVFNQNAHDLARYVSDHPELQPLIPFKIDPKTRSFSADEWDRFNKAVNDYVHNQMAGFTGSGEPLVVPPATKERGGVFQPELTGEAPKPIPQDVSDLINHLFSSQGQLSAIPRTNIARGSVIPRNIQAQEISEATKPGRVAPLVVPRAFAGPGAEKLGVQGVPIQEVNPLRGKLKAAAPNLPEPKNVLQQLNVDNIKKITPAPELPQFRGNVLTTTAGFMPAETQAFLDKIDKSTPEEWSNSIKSFRGRFGGGQTGLSFEIGSKISTPEELQALRESYGKNSELVTAALKTHDFESASIFASKAQAAKEAYESATGRTFEGKGGAADFIKRNYDQNYSPPMEKPEEQPKTFIVRHGSTEMNNADPDKDRIRGHQDIPLSAKGTQESEDAANQLADSGIKTIYTSDLSRAADTAKAIADKTGAPVIPDERLRPWKFGPTIEGKPTTQMLPKIADLADNPDKRPEGGETFNEFKDRFLSAYHDIQDRHLNDNTAIVTHYRGTRLLDAWRAAGVDNDNVDKAVFDAYSPDTKPGNVTTIDKQGNEIAPQDNTVQAMPARKSKEDWKLKEDPSQLFSKAWITPDGKPIQLGGQWHHEWVDQNPDIAGKYGLKPTTSGEENRAQALQKGFARINYERNTGTLKVEARAKDWPKLRESVRRMAEVNLGKIDNMDVHLLDDKAKKIVDQDGVALHTYDADEKMDHLPLISEPTSTTTMSAQAPAEQLRSEGVQFMPGGDPRAIRAAAVVDPETGEQWEGPSHFMALQKAYQAGRTVFDFSKLLHGFLTNSGEYLDRDQAYKRALELNQLKNQTPEDWQKAEKFRETMPGELASETAQYKPGPTPKESDFKDEKTLLPALKSPNWAILTATQEARGKGTDEVNDVANDNLEKALIADGHNPIPVSGNYKGEDQGKNFLVPGMTPAQATEWGNKYNQESVLVPHGLQFADGSYHPVDHSKTVIGPEAKKQDFYSQVKDGPAFSMGIDFDKKLPAQVMPHLEKPYELSETPEDTMRIYSEGKIPLDAARVRAMAKKFRNWKEKGGTYPFPPIKIDYTSKVIDGMHRFAASELAGVIPQTSQAMPQQTLFGGGEERRPLSGNEIGSMTQKEIMDHFPEALVPNRVRNKKGELVDPNVPSDIVGSPVAKKEGVAGFTKRLVDFARSVEDTPEYQNGLKWYSEFTPKLKKEFGSDAPMMAELLAATSPNVTPDQNFAYALDALEQFKQGKFDKQIKKFNDGLDKLQNGSLQKWAAKKTGEADISESAALAEWVQAHDLLPKQTNGKKFSMHSDAVLKVLARKWLEQTQGPKTQNFVKNLLGTGHDATIDVWADRTMRRLGYSDTEPRWRIFPTNSTGVSDVDFAFSQEAFKQAAKELGVRPDSLQGALWFAEKRLWADNGWGRLDLGDFRKEIEKLPLLRAGIQQRMATSKAAAKAKPTEQTRLFPSPDIAPTVKPIERR